MILLEYEIAGKLQQVTNCNQISLKARHMTLFYNRYKIQQINVEVWHLPYRLSLAPASHCMSAE